MEDDTPTPSTTPPPAARTAQALRELHDRARTALAAQRERMVQLEAQLTHQLDTIADTLAEQIASHGGSNSHAQQSLREVEQLRAELEKTRLEWTAERDAWQAERAQFVAADCDRSESLDQRQKELETRQQTLDERATDLNHQDRELRQRQELLDSYALQCAAQQSELTATECALDKQRDEIADRETAVQASQAQLDQAQNELRTRDEKHERDQATLAAERTSLDAEREALQAERAGLEVDRAKLQAEHAALDALTAANQHDDSESAARLASLEQQLSTERTAWDRERASVDEQRRLLATERDDLATALEAARGELATARANAATADERDELQQKFDLALDDMQRLRARVADLEQELASRPAPDEADSVELVHLRAERDDLAERVATMELTSAAPAEADVTQEQVDLQRRFELAVEDVRDLKRKNAELEARIAATKSHVMPASSTPGVGSWEAMKKQMLANLEGEGDDVDEGRRQERATIENTIRITDAALSRKDWEIAELKSQLAEGVSKGPDRDGAEQQLVDADEVIAEHRARIAKLEEEMTEKLRAAELEISVERAKITRDTAHLAELKAEIDAQRVRGELPVGPGGVQQPKRRWLSKLGLNVDDDE